MKTLVVLSALATIALAAPAQQENDLKEAARVFQGHFRTPEQMKREVKSPELSSDAIMHSEPSTEHHNDADTSASTGRNTFKKPIIIKKKVDYHIYRDSDEETMNTDSTEVCGRHLKVKLCADEKKITELLRNSEISKVQGMEQEMKQSIMKAKEAVENLQRGFKKMEKDNDAIKQLDKSQTNPNVEDDIEVAKQMLQHLQDRFGNLSDDSIGLRETEELHNEHLISAKPEERMVQWKEAMSNKQNDAKFTTNIEDNLTNNPADISQRLLANRKEKKPEEQLESSSTEAPSNLQRMSLINTDDHKRSLSDQASIEHLHDVQNRREQQLEDDMKSSASENIQMKAINIENLDTLMSENQEQVKSALEDIRDIHDTHLKGIADQGVLAKNSMPERSAADAMDSKKQEQFLKQKDDVEKFVKDTMFKNSQDNQEMPIDSHEINFQLKDSRDLLMQDMNKNLQAKAAEHMIDNNQKEKTLEDAKLNHIERSHIPNEFVQKAISENIEEKSVMKSVEQHHHKMHDIMEKSENFMNVADQAEQARKHLLDHKAISSKMKSTEEPLQTSTRNFDEDHKKLMKSSDLGHIEQNNIQNIDYNETDHEQALKKMKSSDDHVHLTDFISIDDDQHDSLMKATEGDSCEDSDEKAKVTTMKSLENDSTKSFNIESNDLQQHNYKNMQLEQTATTNVKTTADKLLNEFHKTNEANQVVTGVTDHIQQDAKKQQDKKDMIQKSLLSNVKSAEEPWHRHLSSLKSAEEHMHHHFHHADAMHNAHLVHENGPMASMKAVGEHIKEFHGHDHRKNPHIREDEHMLSKMRIMHGVDLLDHAHANVHAAARHQNMNSHSNIHDMDFMSGGKMQPHLHASMRDAMDGLESDHTFRWLPSHDVPRSAYGGGGGGGGGSGGASSSGGAVGVFPNANTGGCGIPLLLSCSPSVVSGSLAKPHPLPQPSYSAPSYRTEDDFGFLNKRDVKKTSEGHNTNILRSPAIIKRKAGTTMKTQ